jgi:hypothetical protein
MSAPDFVFPHVERLFFCGFNGDLPHFRLAHCFPALHSLFIDPRGSALQSTLSGLNGLR